jgi:hypothetical protein
MIGEERYCQDCYHRCHCYDSSCQKLMGIGMTDKYTKCGCEKCNCIKEEKTND